MAEQKVYVGEAGAKALYGKVKEDLGAKANKSDMSITAGTGATTIQLMPGLSATVLTEHQDVSGKAEKSEMSVTPGTGPDADKTTIQLKTGTSATVLTSHQDISGKADAATTLAGYGITDAYTKSEVDREIGKTGGFRTAELDPNTGTPAVNSPDSRYIYLTKDGSAPLPDQYKEWIWIEPGQGEQWQAHWELIGNTTVELDLTKTELDRFPLS